MSWSLLSVNMPFVLRDKCNKECTAHHEKMSNAAPRDVALCIRFGKRLRTLRVKKGFKRQIDFSEKLGIENSHLSRLESGTREPKLTMLRTLADALGVTISELTKGL